MKYHILNGDSLAYSFPPLEGQIIVMREAFVDGPVSETFDAAYWTERIAFVADAFDADAADYWTKFGSQLILLRQITNDDEVYLWFENDLFCIVNMMVAVHYIWLHSEPTLYRIFPSADNERWIGFGKDDEIALAALFENRIQLNDDDISFLKSWWKAYVQNDVAALQQLSTIETNAMRFADEVTEAHIARLNENENEKQPEKLLRAIREEILNSRANPQPLDRGDFKKIPDDIFLQVFTEFCKRAGVYGYGDTQIKRILGTN
jgi:hypothetical protein